VERRIAAATESDVLKNIGKVAQKGAERALKFLELEHRGEGGNDTKRLKEFLADSLDQLQVIVADGDLPVVEKTSAIQRVQWDDIGGLDNVKKELYDLLEGPRGGVILYGPPGTGFFPNSTNT
jgi:SpoVK/Ycf46/Vps4 family AAA+-type ATPase